MRGHHDRITDAIHKTQQIFIYIVTKKERRVNRNDTRQNVNGYREIVKKESYGINMNEIGFTDNLSCSVLLQLLRNSVVL